MVTAGDGYYALMEFTSDQLELRARLQMRTPWRSRADVEAHLESCHRLDDR